MMWAELEGWEKRNRDRTAGGAQPESTFVVEPRSTAAIDLRSWGEMRGWAARPEKLENNKFLIKEI